MPIYEIWYKREVNAPNVKVAIEQEKAAPLVFDSITTKGQEPDPTPSQPIGFK